MKSLPNTSEHAFLAQRLEPALSMGGRLAGRKIQRSSLVKAFHSEGTVNMGPGSGYACHSINSMAELTPSQASSEMNGRCSRDGGNLSRDTARTHGTTI